MALRKRKWTTKAGVVKEAWVVDYFDQNKVRRLKTFSRKKDADAWAITAGYEVKQGIHTASSASITVKEAGEQWVDAAERDGLERSTVRQYRQHLNLHIVPHLGNKKLNDLSVATIKTFEDWLRDNGRSRAVITKVIASLGALLADAQEAGRVARNVVRERPKKRRQKSQQSRHRKQLEVGVDIPLPEEINAALATLHGYGRAIFLTAARTGLRSSELRALRWSDVDFEGKEIRVRQRADRWNKLDVPKSAAGRREIPMSAMLINTLKEWRLEAGNNPLDLVFANGSGNIENNGNLYARVFGPAWVAGGAADEAGKSKYGIHSLRHFFASWLINEKSRGGLGISLKRAQVLLGHSSLQMTADTYGHLLPSQGDESDEFSAGEQAILA